MTIFLPLIIKDKSTTYVNGKPFFNMCHLLKLKRWKCNK